VPTAIDRENVKRCACATRDARVGDQTARTQLDLFLDDSDSVRPAKSSQLVKPVIRAGSTGKRFPGRQTLWLRFAPDAI